MGTVSCHNELSVNGARGSKMVAQALSMGEGTGRQSTSITEADAAHTVENLKKLNFEVLEHPVYSLDLTPSDSPVWSTALFFLNMKHTVRIIIDSPSYNKTYPCSLKSAQTGNVVKNVQSIKGYRRTLTL